MSNELNQVLKQRRQKASELADLGVNLYANDFTPSHPVKELLTMAEEITDETEADQGPSYTIGGRIIALRKFGKAAFLHIQDESGRIQIYVKRDVVGTDAYAIFKKLDIGDIAGFSGRLFRTNKGELTLQAVTVKPITKSLRPLPEKFHGLTDIETRYRQRYVDLIVNQEVRETFIKRTQIIDIIINFFKEKDFLEV